MARPIGLALFAGVLATLAVALALWSAWQGLRMAVVRLRPRRGDGRLPGPPA